MVDMKKKKFKTMFGGGVPSASYSPIQTWAKATLEKTHLICKNSNKRTRFTFTFTTGKKKIPLFSDFVEDMVTNFRGQIYSVIGLH